MKKISAFLLNWYPLFLIFIFAAFIRMWKLGELPFNLQEDEVMTGYVGRFILENGKDVYGNPWPLWYFDKFGDYYIILPIYLKGLSTYIFGINEFAIRFPSALLGSLSAISIFFLSYWIFNNKKVGYISAIIFTILPWHITLSRASSEGVQGLFFFSFGLMFLIRFIQKNNLLYFILTCVLFLISYWIYHPYRIIVPTTFLFLGGILFLSKEKSKLIYILCAFLLFISLTGYISTTKWGKGRFTQTSIFSPLSGVQIRLQELIYDEGQQKITIARIFHNKIFGYGREFLNQYSRYFSGEYLFVKGGLSYAYAVPEQGLLYLSCLIFLVAGFFFIIRGNYPKENKISIYLFFGLLFIVPIPASLTYVDAPNIQRSVDMTIFLSVIMGYGFYHLLKFKKYKGFIGKIIILILLSEVIYFWHNYTVHSNLFTSIYRNDGQKTLVSYIKSKRGIYEKIFIPTYGTMSMYYLYFTNDFNPSYIGKIKYDVRLDQSKNVYFIDAGCTSDKISEADLKKNILVVDKNNCQADGRKFKQIGEIWGVNKLLNFKILIPNKEYSSEI